MQNKTNLRPAAKSGGRKNINDVILIVALLALAGIAALALFLFRTEGDTVTVSVDGKLFGEYPLGVDNRVEIRNGEGYNLLVIKDGTAYVEQASCPDGICSSHRPIKHDGESIICLPNKVVVEVRTQNDGGPDIVT